MSTTVIAERGPATETTEITEITEARVAEMIRAVELEVEADEFGLRSRAEHTLWEELVVEYELRCQREGAWWVAEPAA